MNILKFRNHLIGRIHVVLKLYLGKIKRLFCSSDILISYKEVPIIINNFNRLDCLKKLLSRLKLDGYKNIYIIDNNSTYPPLLEFYDQIPYTIFRLKKNYGYLSLWKSGLFKKFRREYFVYTDPDVVPIKEAPDNYVEVFYKIMKKYRNAVKVGFSLKIDDLPDCYISKKKVIENEKIFYKYEIEKNVYSAPIDTTFALYRPYTNGKLTCSAIKVGPLCLKNVNIRVGFPFMARHIPWYQNSTELSSEDIYYKNHLEKSTHWSKQM